VSALSYASGRHLQANGLRFYLLEQGEGPLVLLCHGWPELAWSWRHQIAPLAQAGYRVVAPDLRGFGGTDAPDDIGAYTMLHHVGDMVGLVQALGEERAIIVGHDWGAQVAWNAALMRPDVFRAVAGLSVPYAPRGRRSMLEAARQHRLHRFYMLYFQDVGVAEAVLDRDPHDALLRLLCSASGDIDAHRQGWPFVIPEGLTILDACPRPEKHPRWIPEADLRVYSDVYRRTGFRGGLNWYRCIDRTWELTAEWLDVPIPVPALFIGGERDAVLRMPGLNSAMSEFARTLPRLHRSELLPGVGHWIQQEAPERVTALLLEFFATLR
jgi:pimeloyl-ACP methyl ester carboxylesterase